MSDSKSHKTQITVALIGAIALIIAAFIGIFPKLIETNTVVPQPINLDKVAPKKPDNNIVETKKIISNNDSDREWSNKISKQENCNKENSTYADIRLGFGYPFFNTLSSQSRKVKVLKVSGKIHEKSDYNKAIGPNFRKTDFLNNDNKWYVNKNNDIKVITTEKPYEVINEPSYYSDSKNDSNLVIVYDVHYMFHNSDTDEIEEYKNRDCIFYRIIK